MGLGSLHRRARARRTTCARCRRAWWCARPPGCTPSPPLTAATSGPPSRTATSGATRCRRPRRRSRAYLWGAAASRSRARRGWSTTRHLCAWTGGGHGSAVSHSAQTRPPSAGSAGGLRQGLIVMARAPWRRQVGGFLQGSAPRGGAGENSDRPNFKPGPVDGNLDRFMFSFVGQKLTRTRQMWAKSSSFRVSSEFGRSGCSRPILGRSRTKLVNLWRHRPN